MEERLAEIQIVDRFKPVLRSVFLFVFRLEVKGHEIGHVRMIVRMNHRLLDRVIHPLVEDRSRQQQRCDLAAQEKFRPVGRSFLVVFFDDAFNGHRLAVPIVFVHFQNVLVLGFVFRQNIRAAVQQLIVAGSELAAAFLDELTVGGEEQREREQLQSVGQRFDELIPHRVIV